MRAPCRIRLVERTRDFHSRNKGSIPLFGTLLCQGMCYDTGMNDFEFGWLCGILEGEGSFTICHYMDYDNRRKKAYPATTCLIRVTSTDKEIVDKIHELTQIGNVKPKQVHSPLSKKPQFEWRVGRKADLKEFLPKIVNHLSGRRQEKIKEILKHLSQ